MTLIASILFGLAAAALAWSLASGTDKTEAAGVDAERREELRKRDPAVKFAEGLFDTVTQYNAKRPSKASQETQRQLDLLYPGVWTASEYLAAAQIQGAFVGIFVLILGLIFEAGVLAAAFGLGVALMYPMLKTSNLKKLAGLRKYKVRSRLPFVLDLTSLMMESGALFNACIQTVVQETGKHPIAEELSRVLASLRQGLPRATALKEFASRLDDNDVDEVVFAVNTSEELGTPLDKTLRTMADRMRQRRMQELERRAEIAKVNITWPAMLVMVACLLIVAAPLMLAGSM